MTKNKVVAHKIDGKPLTAAQYRREIVEAEAEIERGEYLTNEEMKKEARYFTGI